MLVADKMVHSFGPNVLRAAVCLHCRTAVLTLSTLARARTMHALAMHVDCMASLLSSEQLTVVRVLRSDSASRYDAALKGPGPVRIINTGTGLDSGCQ